MAQQVGVRGYHGYTVDEDGNVYSYRSGSCRKLSQRDHRGYLHVTIRDCNHPVKIHKEPVHKLVLSSFVGVREDGMVCRHLNGNAHDNRLVNLCWGTPKENVDDSIRHGTAICLRLGEEHVASKLTNEEVVQIREKYSVGYKQSELANAYGVTQRHISDIVRFRTRKKG